MMRLTLVMLMFSVAGCGITGPENITLQLAGTVTAQATGQPVAGALIELVPPSLFGNGDQDLVRRATDAQGRYAIFFSIKKPCRGNGFGLVLTASDSGFTPLTNQVVCTGTAQQIDFNLVAAP